MPLPRVYHAIQDQDGHAVPSVQCSVLVRGTGALAALFNDADGLQPAPNPFTSDGLDGTLAFYVAAGHYDLTFAKPGYNLKPLLDYQVPPDQVMLGDLAYQQANAVHIMGGNIGGATRIDVESAVWGQ